MSIDPDHMRRASEAIARNEEAKRLGLGGYGKAGKDPALIASEVQAVMDRIRARLQPKPLSEVARAPAERSWETDD